jgi:hypothetical protein
VLREEFPVLLLCVRRGGTDTTGLVLVVICGDLCSLAGEVTRELAGADLLLVRGILVTTSDLVEGSFLTGAVPVGVDFPPA